MKILQGKRIADGTEPHLLQVGEYCKYKYHFESGDMCFYVMAPNGSLGCLVNHTVIEHEDGTITVQPSILISKGRPGEWHGYLEKGVWREI
jgi:hypothetical protein